jgi:hypothetical protein
MREPQPPPPGKQIDQTIVPWEHTDLPPVIRRRLRTLCGCTGTTDILVGQALANLNQRAITLHTPYPVYETAVYPVASIMKGLATEPLAGRVNYQGKRRFGVRSPAHVSEGVRFYVEYDELGWC